MSTTPHRDVVSHWQEIVGGFVKLGVTAYGGPAIMGLMQAELQEKRPWVTRERFVEGLSFVNMLPGAGATQLGIFLGHARGGWRGGLLAGLCFMVAAYVGSKVTGIAGAAVAAAAVFGPSFLLMLSMLPVFERVRTLVWIRAAMRGVGPAVIGVMAVFLVRMAPHALPDLWAMVILLGTLIALLAWRTSAMTLRGAGAVVGVLRSRVWPLPGVKAAL